MSRPIPESITDKDQKLREMGSLLIECRDALPAITMVQAKLYGVDLRLADRIEACLEPWRIEDENAKPDAD